jgi:hypothetical protein
VANLHALHNQTQYQSKADLLHFTTLGERLKEQLLNHLYTLCITGNIIADTSGRVIQRASRRSLEYFLHDKQIKTTFLNFRDSDSSYQSMQMHCNQGFGLYACWPNMTDGIIFIDTLKTFITYE